MLLDLSFVLLSIGRSDPVPRLELILPGVGFRSCFHVVALSLKFFSAAGSFTTVVRSRIRSRASGASTCLCVKFLLSDFYCSVRWLIRSVHLDFLDSLTGSPRGSRSAGSLRTNLRSFFFFCLEFAGSGLQLLPLFSAAGVQFPVSFFLPLGFFFQLERLFPAVRSICYFQLTWPSALASVFHRARRRLFVLRTCLLPWPFRPRPFCASSALIGRRWSRSTGLYRTRFFCLLPLLLLPASRCSWFCLYQLVILLCVQFPNPILRINSCPVAIWSWSS
jgi:hypothetical protein